MHLCVLAQCKHRSLHVPNLIPVLVNPNDLNLMVDPDVELNIISKTQFIFTMFNGLKCLQVDINCSKLCIKFGTFETKLLHSWNSHVGHTILIHGSTQIRHVELNWINCQSFHVHRQWKTQLWRQLLNFRVCMFVKKAVIEGIRFGTWKDQCLNCMGLRNINYFALEMLFRKNITKGVMLRCWTLSGKLYLTYIFLLFAQLYN